jgi:hypothetical protein
MTMTEHVTIYISAAPKLMTERETLARMIAELPVTLSWRIGQTPAHAEPVDTNLLRDADLYFLVMGTDIQAPVGVELHAAQSVGHPVIAFLKQGMARTPAGEIFTKQTRVTWHQFKDATDLSRSVQQIIVEHLLKNALRYTLTPVELTQLQELLDSTRTTASTSEGDGTGHSAVLLSPERYTPSDGVVIED